MRESFPRQPEVALRRGDVADDDVAVERRGRPFRLEQAAHDERARGARGRSPSTRLPMLRPRSRANGAGRMIASGPKSAK